MSNRREFMGQLVTGAGSLAVSNMVSGRILGANDRIRIGLIGGGGRGQEIFKAALRCQNVEAVAVADVYTGRLDEVKALLPQVKTYRDQRQLLDDKTIDAVLIATPQHQHALNFVPAIQAGKDIYQEKTMAFNPDHAKRMRKAFQGSGRVVQIGMQMISGPGLEKVAEYVTPDKMGDDHRDQRPPLPQCSLRRLDEEDSAGLRRRSTSTGTPSRAKLRNTRSIRSVTATGGSSGIIPAEMSSKT